MDVMGIMDAPWPRSARSPRFFGSSVGGLLHLPKPVPRVLWVGRRDFCWQQVGLDVCGIEKSACSFLEISEGAKLTGAASGRREWDLGGWVGQREGLGCAQLVEGLRAKEQSHAVLIRLQILPQFEDKLRVRRSVVGNAVRLPVQIKYAAQVAEIAVMAADVNQARAHGTEGSLNRMGVLRLRGLLQSVQNVRHQVGAADVGR